MNSICVFLGSSIGNHPAYMEAADAMGRELAARGLTCVYGGSCTGLMNQLANSALAAGGKVLGVTVQALKDKENFHQGLTKLYVLPTMHERKNLMVQISTRSTWRRDRMLQQQLSSAPTVLTFPMRLNIMETESQMI